MAVRIVSFFLVTCGPAVRHFNARFPELTGQCCGVEALFSMVYYHSHFPARSLPSLGLKSTKSGPNILFAAFQICGHSVPRGQSASFSLGSYIPPKYEAQTTRARWSRGWWWAHHSRQRWSTTPRPCCRFCTSALSWPCALAAPHCPHFAIRSPLRPVLGIAPPCSVLSQFCSTI